MELSARIAGLRDHLTAGGPRDWVRRGVFALLLVTVIWVMVEIVQLTITKAYAIDEYLYVHMAWLAAHGQGLLDSAVIGFGVVQPILYAPFTFIGGDNPASMIFVRAAALVFLTIGATAFGWTVATLSGGQRRIWALLGVLCLLTVSRFVWHAIEVRPDGVAVMFLFVGLAGLVSPGLSNRNAAIIGGVALALACLTSLKSVLIGSVYFPVFVLDLWAWRKRRPQVLRCWIAFVASFALVIGAFLLTLAADGRLGEYASQLLHGAASHEKHMPGFSSYRFFDPMLAKNATLFALAAAGVAASVVTVVRRFRDERVVDARILPLLLLLSAWVSFFVQKSAYAYSLLPGIALTVLFAALALVALARALRPAAEANWLVALTGMASAAAMVIFSVHRWAEPEHTNRRQRELQSLLHELVPPGQAVWDMSAAYVFRPHAHRYLFIDNARKSRDQQLLEAEVPQALIQREVTLVIWDIRMAGWRTAPLGRWITEHYQKLNDDFRVWGRHYPKRKDAPWTADFQAIKDGSYFIHPASALENAGVEIDGKPVVQSVFPLRKGDHKVTVKGSAPSFYLLWLPANGEAFDPTADSPKYELGRFVLP